MCSSSAESVVSIHLVYVTLKISEWSKISKSYTFKRVVLFIGDNKILVKLLYTRFLGVTSLYVYII
jgi:hypothetical protein